MKLYNTLHHKKENFAPIKKNNVGLYTCGPTVYNFAHIGNFRAYITADVLQRYLRFTNYKVRWVMNITDVDDKIIRDSKKEYPKLELMQALEKFTQEYEKTFWQDMAKLNIKKSDFYKNPRATDTIKEMQELVLKILNKGYAYIKNGSIYFDVKKYAKDYKYGQLVTLDMRGFKAGVRIDADEYEKENVQDFVLWKSNLSTSSRSSKKGEPSWDFEIKGKNYAGRPGWHIECSAMSNKFLGKKFDIHSGGVDLKFPHHENEIAQSTVGFGAEPVNFWLHNEYLQVDGGKMSKSKNNFYTLSDLEKRGVNPLSLRYLMLTASYRVPLNFTWKSLEGAGAALGRLYDVMRVLQTKTKKQKNKKTLDDECVCRVCRKKFVSAISDDLDMPKGLAIMWDLIKSDEPGSAKKATLLEFDKVLGLGLARVKKTEIPEKIKKLAQEREQARKDKNWKKADELRERIEKERFGVEDTDEGVRIFKA